jgi:hypothetical protein
MKKIIIIFVSLFILGCSDTEENRPIVENKSNKKETQVYTKESLSPWLGKMQSIDAKTIKQENLAKYNKRKKQQFKRTEDKKILPPPTPQTIDLH